MQAAIRILRYALPIIFLGFVAIIALSWTRTRNVQDKAPNEPVVTNRADRAIIESRGFEDTQTIAGRVVSHIVAKRVVAYASNWNTLEEVKLTIYRPNGLTYQLSCPQAQFNSETKEAEAKGGVKVTSSDGVEISTAEIHYDGSRLTNKVAVEFRIDRWSGNGGALDLDVGGETVRLFQKMTATMAPAHPGEAPMNLAAEECLFRRKDNDVEFKSSVLLTRQADSLKSDRVFARFTPDRRTIIALEGQGQVVIGMASNAAANEDLGGRKEIHCDRFWSELSPQGKIHAINAQGDPGQAHAIMDGPPKRDVTAKSFRIALAERAVSELKADGQVIMKELTVPPREVSSDRVTVGFNPQTHRAHTAFLDGNVKYADPKNTASAMRAHYDIAGDKVLLSADYGFDPTVVADGQTLKAKQIEFSPKAGTARASGTVIAQLTSKGGAPSADTTNLFPANKPVFVNADLLVLRQAQRIAVFSGNVKAWQDANTIFCNEMQVQGAGESVTARGNVRSVLYNATGTEARKTPVQTRSDQLTARKSERRIDMTGAVKIDDELRTVTAEHAAFFMDASRKIERIEADKNVQVIERGTGRKGSGDKATYLVAKKMIYVNGTPATVTAPNGNFSGQQISIDLARNKVEVVSTTAETKGTYKQP